MKTQRERKMRCSIYKTSSGTPSFFPFSRKETMTLQYSEKPTYKYKINPSYGQRKIGYINIRRNRIPDVLIYIFRQTFPTEGTIKSFNQIRLGILITEPVDLIWERFEDLGTFYFIGVIRCSSEIT